MRKKTDSNQKEIIRQLKSIGASVVDTSAVGKGFPDLVVGYQKQTYLVEVKSSNKAYGKSLNENQVKFKDAWKGSEIILVRNIEDFISFINNKGDKKNVFTN